MGGARGQQGKSGHANQSSTRTSTSIYAQHICGVGNQQQSRWQMTHLQAPTCGGIRTLANSVASHSLSGRTNPGGGS